MRGEDVHGLCCLFKLPLVVGRVLSSRVGADERCVKPDVPGDLVQHERCVKSPPAWSVD